MNPERLKKLSKLSLEEIMALTYKDFTVSEIEYLISETPMRDDDKRLSVYKFINGMTYEEIADKLGIDVKTAKRRRIRITLEIRLTILKLIESM